MINRVISTITQHQLNNNWTMQIKPCLSLLSTSQRSRCDWRSNSKIQRQWQITPHRIGMKCYSPLIGTRSTWMVFPADLPPQPSLALATSAKCARAMPTKTNCHKLWLTRTNIITRSAHPKEDISNSSSSRSTNHGTRESWPSVTIITDQSRAIPS